MKFSLKTLAAAVVMAAAATGAQADIITGAAGNGELFFNIWDANGSYTRGLNVQINTFETGLAATGNVDMMWASDNLLNNWLATADVSTLKWNVVANDTQSANRLLTTYTSPEMAATVQNDVIRTAGSNVTSFLNTVNPIMANTAGASMTAAVGTPGYAGVSTFGEKINNKLNFSSAGTLANDSFSSGLGFMRIDALVGGSAKSVYNEYLDGSTAVNVWLDSANTLHIGAVAAVPEPSEYAMLLAGLGMIGFMASRNKRA
ncbi:MAG: PEP-CTERM sorting domain-containing protein [Azonexus sp.]